MLYNNTASINYLEINRLNPSSSSIILNAPITASLITSIDYRGTTNLLTHVFYPLLTYNTNVLAPNTTSIAIMRICEISNDQLKQVSGSIAEFTYSPLIQNGDTGGLKTWRLYVNSTSSLDNATQVATLNYSNNAGSRRDFNGNFFVSASVPFYISASAWNNFKFTMSYDTISSSLFVINTVQKASAVDLCRDHYAFITVNTTPTRNQEVFPP